MNRLTKPKAQMLPGIARKPVGAGRGSADWAFFIGVALVARYTSTTTADKGRIRLLWRQKARHHPKATTDNTVEANWRLGVPCADHRLLSG